MRVVKDQKGFSLVELVVVAGIVAILAAVAIRMVSYIRSANIEKTTQYISDALTKQQMKSMSKERKPYLYIYKIGDKYYYCLSEESEYNISTMGTHGKELGTGITITYNNGTMDKTIDESNKLIICYKKDGTFTKYQSSLLPLTIDVPKNIKITSGSTTRTIKINELTGKHIITND